jgi:hypothetical protein
MTKPLRKTFSPTHPFELHRRDQEDGSIDYEIWDMRPISYRRLCTISDEYSVTRGQAKRDAEAIVRALNLTSAER